MQRTNQALEERGELLSNLNESMNNIGQGATDFLKEAKGLAFKQGKAHSECEAAIAHKLNRSQGQVWKLHVEDSVYHA